MMAHKEYNSIVLFKHFHIECCSFAPFNANLKCKSSKIDDEIDINLCCIRGVYLRVTHVLIIIK